MQIVLLAAGLGTRLKELTRSVPKTLVGLEGRALVDYIFASIELPQVDEVIVVGGYRFETLGEHVKAHATRPLRLVKNEEYDKGSILTVRAALPYVKGGFLLMNADHIHPRTMIRQLADCNDEITCACDRDRGLTDDDMKVKLNASGGVLLMDKKLTEWDCGYIGMTRVPDSQVEAYRGFVERTLEERGESANVEGIIQNMADHGEHASICDLSGHGWIEVDNQTDLVRAHELLREKPGLRALLDEAARTT